MRVGNYVCFGVKKFFQKHKETLIIGSVVLLIAAAGLVSYLGAAEEGGSSLVRVINPSPVSTSTAVDPKIKEFGLAIGKLNILVPVVKDVDGNNKKLYNESLQNGVAHYKGTALPGEKGNIFIFGHSSATVKGDYWEIFAPLNDLEENDEVVVYYENNEHKYKVKEKKIVEATDLSVLDKGKAEILTLMTCWPVGTKEKRLVIKAEPS